MTPQEALNKAVTAMREQGAPARGYRDGRDVCLYVANKGKRCAVGHLLTNEEIATLVERGKVLAPAGSIRVHCPSLQGLPPAFLFELQRCHDNASVLNFLPEFEEAARKLAHKYELEYPSE
jgi:hypothetical protein